MSLIAGLLALVGNCVLLGVYVSVLFLDRVYAALLGSPEAEALGRFALLVDLAVVGLLVFALAYAVYRQATRGSRVDRLWLLAGFVVLYVPANSLAWYLEFVGNWRGLRDGQVAFALIPSTLKLAFLYYPATGALLEFVERVTLGRYRGREVT